MHFTHDILAEAPDKECEVLIDEKGSHCPEEPKHYVCHRGRMVWLCEKCYQNWVSGVYDEVSPFKETIISLEQVKTNKKRWQFWRKQ